MITVTDHIGHQISLSGPAQRIVSTVPSQTEVLADLGLEVEVVGITEFCVHPTGWLDQKELIGGTKNINTKRVLSLEPDLVIANKEENQKRHIDRLSDKVPVWTSDVQSIDDALDMIKALGNLTGKTERATYLVEDIKNTRDGYQRPDFGSALYFIWKDPLMVAGNDTFIHAMMKEAGFTNAVKTNRYPSLSLPDIVTISPDYILLSSEPFPFDQSHLADLKRLCPESKIDIVDGEMFSWYGSRLNKAYQYFENKKEFWFNL